MWWFAVAAVAMSAMQATKQANMQNTAAAQAYTQSLKQANAQNDAIMQANTANMIRTGYRIGLQNLQKSRAVLQASQQGFDLSAKGIEALGANQAQAAASGTVGSSVDAVTQDIQKKVAETQIGYDQSFEQLMENANIGIEQTVMAGRDALLSSVKPNHIAPYMQNPTQAGIAAGLGTLANMYASGNMSLGNAPAADTSSFSMATLGGLQGSLSSAMSQRQVSNNFTIQ